MLPINIDKVLTRWHGTNGNPKSRTLQWLVRQRPMSVAVALVLCFQDPALAAPLRGPTRLRFFDAVVLVHEVPVPAFQIFLAVSSATYPDYQPTKL